MCLRFINTLLYPLNNNVACYLRVYYENPLPSNRLLNIPFLVQLIKLSWKQPLFLLVQERWILFGNLFLKERKEIKAALQRIRSGEKYKTKSIHLIEGSGPI